MGTSAIEVIEQIRKRIADWDEDDRKPVEEVLFSVEEDLLVKTGEMIKYPMRNGGRDETEERTGRPHRDHFAIRRYPGKFKYTIDHLPTKMIALYLDSVERAKFIADQMILLMGPLIGTDNPDDFTKVMPNDFMKYMLWARRVEDDEVVDYASWSKGEWNSVLAVQEEQWDPILVSQYEPDRFDTI